MQINITSLIKSPAFVPFDMSNNAATLGDNAGKLTWGASLECAPRLFLADIGENKGDLFFYIGQ